MIFNKTKLAKIAKKYNLKQIILFGSQSVRQNTSESDFDIGILSQKPLSTQRQEALLIDFSQKLGVPIQRLDLTMLNHASPLLLFQSVKNARLLFGQPRFFTAFKLYAIKQYQDHQKIFKLLDNYLQQQYA